MLKFLQAHSKFYTILVHILVWTAFLLIPLLFIESPEGITRFIIFGWSNLVIMAGFFYVNYFYLIPVFLLKQKIFPYIMYLMLGLVVIMLLNMSYDYLVHVIVFNREHHHSFFRFSSIYPALLAFAASTSIRITNEWLKTEKQKREMENEKLIAELAFLKSQVNPHFLFNILNNICSLARKKSDNTENAILKLSHIMRYMMYDSKDEKVSLDKEVEYLRNYIELQRMRISERIKINFTITGNTDQWLIEPLLLIPFVENAFKHGVSYMEDSWIDIILKVDGNELNFHVENTVVKNGDKTVSTEPGMGLKNIIRRLELLYPDRHDLTIREKNSMYVVDLKIRQ